MPFFHYNDYFVIGRIRTYLGVSDDPMFLWISSREASHAEVTQAAAIKRNGTAFL